MHAWLPPYPINTKSSWACYCCSQTHPLCLFFFFLTKILEFSLMGALKREMGERVPQGIGSAFTSMSRRKVSHDKSKALQPPLSSFRPTRAPSRFVQWLCPCSLRRLQQRAIASLMKFSIILPHSCCQCFQSEPRLLLHGSAVPSVWQMVCSDAAATAERTWWRCDSTIKIFQRCCSGNLQWGKGTV